MNSVVILDEAQMLPVNLLRPCLAALKELTSYYKTSIVLCTATQPALKKSEDDFPDGLDDVHEIIEQPRQLYQSLKRAHVHPIGKITDDDLAAQIAQHQQVLCIVNTRAHARNLYEQIRHLPGARHLSALMCPRHRSIFIYLIRRALRFGKPCRVVSTQLIEAGVDIDFPVVYRASAGIDSIAQAAGRCNREGKLALAGQVYIFNPDREGLPRHFQQAAQIGENIARRRSADLLDLEAVRCYFQEFYWLKGDELDAKEILDDIRETATRGDFPFKAIDEKFRIIDNIMHPVIIPWCDEGKRLIETIRCYGASASLARRAQRFTVQLYTNDFAPLVQSGSVEILDENYPVLVNTDLYRKDTGLSADDPTFLDPERIVV